MTDHERSVVRHGGVWFFLVLFSYYFFRPMREQISATYGVQNLGWMFAATFIAMLVAIPVFSAFVSKFNRRKLVPCIYVFFVLCVVAFWSTFTFAPRTQGPEPHPIQLLTAQIFFVWISVYGLFIVSFFWSVIGDMLTLEQGRRLFGYVFACGTAGGMLGSAMTKALVERIGQANLLLFPATALGLGLFVYLHLERTHQRLKPEGSLVGSGRATGGNPFAGFTAIFKSPYLLAIAAYALLMATCGTITYFAQSEIVKETFATPEAKTAFFAKVDFFTNATSIVLQTFVVRRLIKWFGLGITLAVLPLAAAASLGALAVSPTIGTIAIIAVIGRAAEYSIMNPAREVLFTTVSREDRYKAKSFIDTIVRRGGDSLVGQVYSQLRQTAGFAMTTVAWMAVPIGLCWAGLALYIGRENKRSAESPESPAADAAKSQLAATLRSEKHSNEDDSAD